MGNMMNYPIVTEISSDDSFFINQNGQLKQIRKVDLNFGGGGGGASLEWTFKGDYNLSSNSGMEFTQEEYDSLTEILVRTKISSGTDIWCNVILTKGIDSTVVSGYYYDSSYHGSCAFRLNNSARLLFSNPDWHRVTINGTQYITDVKVYYR